MIVEDERINREMLGFILQLHYNVLYAENGKEALEVLRSSSVTVSMILLDINMPVMNGYEFMDELQKDPRLSNIPVIVLTADSSAEVKALNKKALDFIPKPYNLPEVILARVKRIIEFAEDRRIIKDIEHDELTGLYTRGFFFEYSGTLFRERKDKQFDMIAIDIDRFRLINELYGKSIGDSALRAVADGIREICAERNGIGCRSSADLFFIFAEHSDDYSDVVDKITKSLSTIEAVSNVNVRVGVFSGVNGSHNMEWFSDAAKSACRSNRGGKEAVSVYDNELIERELFRQRLLFDIDAAIEQKQLKVFFQPKYKIQGKAPVLYGAEALIRWVHPELGFISPGEFIPLFEEHGQITRVDMFVFSETARLIRLWEDKYGYCPPISVNLSRQDLFDPFLVEKLTRVVKENGITPSSMHLEVVETAYAEDIDHVIGVVSALRELGFEIEMDDFGTGYSSLNMLCLMPIDALKIDMKFVQNIIGIGSGYHILEIVIDLAHNLSVPAIVEGVETEEQYCLVRKAGCDVVQGYYFSRPVDSGSFGQIIESAGKKSESDDKVEPAQVVPYSGIAQALSYCFECIYYVNVVSDGYVEYSSGGMYERLSIEHGGKDFFADTRKNVPRVVYSQDHEKLLRLFDKELLLSELENSNVFSTTYRLVVGGEPYYYNAKVIRVDRDHIVIGVSNIDDQMKLELELQQSRSESDMSTAIARALAKDYFSIYYVDTETNEYVEYSAKSDFRSLTVEQNGTDFFNECIKRIHLLVPKEDVKIALRAFDKSSLMEELVQNHRYSITYRLTVGGALVYVNIKVIMMDDGKHIIVGVSNVDEQRRREIAYLEELGNVRERANRDSLTGVKSKYAYTESEKTLNKQISERACPPFAICVCDVNGLKKVNDTRGHQVGDEYLKKACSLICTVYEHSPVFRIGGDEFVVLLQGRDYNDRDRLLQRIKEEARENDLAAGAIIACGMSEYRTGDSSVSAVFDRADKLMYEHKMAIKADGGDVR